jgi:CheY-like chemotaxis protein
MSGLVAKRTILLASHDPALTDLRKRLLEAAGYFVIVAKTTSELASRCQHHKIDLVLIGSSLPPVEKRKFGAQSRKQCGLVLELYTDGPPELMDDTRAYVHHAVTSVDFLEAVRAVLTSHQSVAPRPLLGETSSPDQRHRYANNENRRNGCGQAANRPHCLYGEIRKLEQ